MNQQQTITIDGAEYNLADLSEKAKGDLTSLQLVDQKIAQSHHESCILRNIVDRHFTFVLCFALG